MRIRQAAVTIGGACGLALSVVQVLAQQTPAPVPIAQEPRHRVVFESGTTRVHDVQIPHGDTTLYHVHDTPILYVPISRSQTRSQVLGEAWSGPPTVAPRAAEASSSSASGSASSMAPSVTSTPGRISSIVSYVERPVTHRVHNIGDGLFRLIAVVNRAAGSESGADDVSGLSEKPEVVNRYYRAHRVTLAPGASTASHAHMTPVVVVQQAAGRVTVEGATTTELREAGTFAFHEGTGPHLIKNVGSTPVDVIEVELRGGRSK